MTIVYVLLFMTGIVGNILVCIVIVRTKSMHNAVNYYLFSLALSDLSILTFGLPNELASFWHQYPYSQGELMCKFRSFVSETATYASVFTIVSFSVERYLAICHPFHVFDTSDFKRVATVLSIGWSVAMSVSVPYLLFTTVNYVDRPLGSGNFLDESAFCALLDANVYPAWYPIHELATLLFFVVPIVILSYLYTRMISTLRSSLRSLAGGISAHAGGGSTARIPHEHSSMHNIALLDNVQRERHKSASQLNEEAALSIPRPALPGRYSDAGHPFNTLQVASTGRLSQPVVQTRKISSSSSCYPNDWTANVQSTSATTTTNLKAERKSSSTYQQRLNVRRQSIRMLTAVVVSFFVCWAPFHAQRLGYVYLRGSLTFRTVNEYLMYISGILYYVSATCNPILYNVMSSKWRSAFQEMLKFKRRVQNQAQPAA